jgi:hypothetical protein
MASPAHRRTPRAGLAGAFGLPLALAMGVTLGALAPLVLGAKASAGRHPTAGLTPAAGGAAGPGAVTRSMVTGPVDDPVMHPQLAQDQLAQHLLAGAAEPPFACTSPTTTTSTSSGSGATTSGPSGASTSTTVPTTAGASGAGTGTTLPSSATSSSVPETTNSPTSTTTPLVPPGERAGYDLLESNGKVDNFGGAGSYGPARALSQGAVSEAVTVDGAGYWILSADGAVGNFGDAIDYGEPHHLTTGKPVAIVATPDGGGYWILTSGGSLDNFGDAPFCGSGVHSSSAGRYVAMAAMPNGDGYWLVTASGAVDAFGSAPTEAPRGQPLGADEATPATGATGASSTTVPASATTTSGSTSAVNATTTSTTTSTAATVATTATGASGASGASGAPVIAAIAATPDGGGYWLLGSTGAVHAFGDAHNYGGGAAKHGVGSFVGIAPTPDGKGYWLATTTGRVFQFGDATPDGSLAHQPPKAPLHVVALTMAVVPPPTTSTGTGSTGSGSTSTTTTTTQPSTTTTTTTTPRTSTTTTVPRHHTTTTTTTTTTTAPKHHTTTTVPKHTTTTVPKRSSTTTTVPRHVTTTTAPAPIPQVHGKFGYDISDFQCAKPGSPAVQSDLPTSSGISVVQVAGWLDSAANPCLAAEAAWATRVAGRRGHPYELYLFMNSPGMNSVALQLEARGPGGVCARLAPAARPSCIAYNYGYNGAVSALAYASKQGVSAREWWLDIENDSLSYNDYSDFGAGDYWSHSTALNDRTISGALNALHRAGIVVGIYSTSVQYPVIAGNFVPGGPRIPLWVAGVPWTSPPFSERGLYAPSMLAPWCAGRASYIGFRRGELFAGGAVQLLQETPGTEPSPYGLDPDYVC